MRKIKLLDREQIILDLSVSTYISLIHPLNRFPTLTQSKTLKENTVVSFRDEDIKENKPCFPLFEKWPRNSTLHIFPLFCFQSLYAEEFLPHTF